MENAWCRLGRGRMIKINFSEETIPIEKISPNPWNPNEQSEFMKERLSKSMERYGQVVEIIVRETTEGNYEIIDGEHRYKEALEQGKGELIVNNLGKIPDDKAKILTMAMNEIHGDRDALKLSKLLNDLSEDESWGIFSEIVPFSALELKTILTLAEDIAAPPLKEKEGDQESAHTWIDLKVSVNEEKFDHFQELINESKGVLRIEEQADPSLENGEILKKLVLTE